MVLSSRHYCKIPALPDIQAIESNISVLLETKLSHHILSISKQALQNKKDYE